MGVGMASVVSPGEMGLPIDILPLQSTELCRVEVSELATCLTCPANAGDPGLGERIPRGLDGRSAHTTTHETLSKGDPPDTSFTVNLRHFFVIVNAAVAPDYVQ